MTDAGGAPAPWWRTYFDDDWFALHEPLFPAQRSREEVAGMIELLGVPDGSRVLDVPCGWGRHTDLLARAGYQAMGADLSHSLLRRAPRRRRQRGPYAAADMRALPFRSGSFDAVVNAFTSLGLFDDDAEDLRALREARRVLVRGGALLLESMHRDDVVCDFAETDRWRLPDGTTVKATRTFEPVTGLSHEVWKWRSGTRSGEKRHVLRLRTATEVAGLMKRAGFRDIEWFGDWSGEPFTHRSARLIAVARTGRRRLPDTTGRR